MIDGATHVGLYDKKEYVDPAISAWEWGGTKTPGGIVPRSTQEPFYASWGDVRNSTVGPKSSMIMLELGFFSKPIILSFSNSASIAIKLSFVFLESAWLKGETWDWLGLTLSTLIIKFGCTSEAL